MKQKCWFYLHFCPNCLWIMPSASPDKKVERLIRLAITSVLMCRNSYAIMEEKKNPSSLAHPSNGLTINQLYLSIQSYLDGKTSCDEVVSIMRESDIPAGNLAGVMRQLSGFGDKDRYSLLHRECRLFRLY